MKTLTKVHWAIIAAGVAAYPMVVGLLFVVWKGGWSAAHQAQQLDILGNTALGAMAIWGLVVVALLGIVRSISAHLPGGADLKVEVSPPSQGPDHG